MEQRYWLRGAQDEAFAGLDRTDGSALRCRADSPQIALFDSAEQATARARWLGEQGRGQFTAETTGENTHPAAIQRRSWEERCWRRLWYDAAGEEQVREQGAEEYGPTPARKPATLFYRIQIVWGTAGGT